MSQRWGKVIKRRTIDESCSGKTTKKRGYLRVRARNKTLVVQITKIWSNPKVILEMQKAAQVAWTRGFVDAEGSVTMTGSKQPMIPVYNKKVNFELLNQSCEKTMRVSIITNIKVDVYGSNT